jgi:hypothetical protein
VTEPLEVDVGELVGEVAVDVSAQVDSLSLVQLRCEPPRKWTDAHREEARRLQLEGVSWSQIAERVCGDKRYKATVGVWLKRDEIPVDH